LNRLRYDVTSFSNSKGTGKTIALLTSCFAFINTFDPEKRPILYVASRTHQQLAQMIEEFYTNSNINLAGSSMAIRGEYNYG